MTENAGINLEKYLSSKGPLPGPQVVRLACQLAKVMGEESESETGTRAPVLHVGRIVITSSGKIDITPSDEADLGLPVVASFPHHASPEEISGEPGDFRSSLYSLGCTLFQIATGELPFNGDSPKEILKAHLNDDIPDPSDKCAEISEELGRAIQELLRKNPEQRIQSLPELVRRLKICLNAEAAPKEAAPPLPPQEKESPAPEESSPKDEEKKTPSLPKIKLPSKNRDSAKDSGKSAEKKSGKPGAGIGRKVASFTKKKSDGKSAKTAAGSKKSFSFSKTRRSESGKSPGGGRKSSFTGSGINLSGKLIDHGDEGDVFEDSFEEEQLGYPVIRKKTRPFIMAGAGLGVVLAVVVVFSSQRASKTRVRADIENKAALAQQQLKKIKAFWKTKYEEQRKIVDTYLARQTNRFNSGESPTVIEGAIEGQLETSMFNKPGAVGLAVLYAKVHARADELRAARKEAELGTERNFESFVNSFNRLYDQGLWAPAMNKIREAENEYTDTKEKEINELFFKAEKKMVVQWNADEQKIKDLASDEQPQKAVQVAEAAKLYGDTQIRKDAVKYIEYIRAQAAVSGAVTEEPETEEKPEEGGVPENLEAELKELEDDDDLR